MTTQNEHKKMVLSSGSIFFGALIGIGILITLGVLGLAVAMSVMPENGDDVPTAVLVIVGILSLALIALSFFIAGFIASKSSHQQLRLDTVVHSIGAWAMMTLFIITVASLGMAVENVQYNFGGVNSPRIVTDIEIFKGKAETTIKNTDNQPDTQKDKDRDVALALGCWFLFVSLVTGLGMAIWGGLMGRRKFALLTEH